MTTSVVDRIRVDSIERYGGMVRAAASGQWPGDMAEVLTLCQKSMQEFESDVERLQAERAAQAAAIEAEVRGIDVQIGEFLKQRSQHEAKKSDLVRRHQELLDQSRQAERQLFVEGREIDAAVEAIRGQVFALQAQRMKLTQQATELRRR